MKAILILDMPKSCDDCEVRCDGYTAKEYAEKGIKRPSWCPLKPLPKRSRPQDVGQVNDLYRAGLYAGWNACLDELEGKK